MGRETVAKPRLHQGLSKKCFACGSILAGTENKPPFAMYLQEDIPQGVFDWLHEYLDCNVFLNELLKYFHLKYCL